VWEAIKYVSSGFSLCAFFAAIAFWYLKSRDQATTARINSAPADKRPELIADLAEVFHVDLQGLTGLQQYRIVMRQLDGRRERFRISAAVVAVVFFLGAGLYAFAIVKDAEAKAAAARELAAKEETAREETARDASAKQQVENSLVTPPTPNAAAVWTDSSTGLMWTARDNGKNVNWNEAVNYCANLAAGGYSSGWELPDINDLAKLYDQLAERQYVYRGPRFNNFEDGHSYSTHIRQQIELGSCCSWSKTRDGNSKAYYFRFHLDDPETFSFDINKSGVVRALCVHRP
jgi:Protein of unknown function (DUF1566)